MSRRKVGRTWTTTEVVLAAVATGAVAYMVFKPQTPRIILPPPTTGSGSNYGNSTSSIINASGSAFSDIWGSIFGGN